jgi:hypothetical protein
VGSWEAAGWKADSGLESLSSSAGKIIAFPPQLWAQHRKPFPNRQIQKQKATAVSEGFNSGFNARSVPFGHSRALKPSLNPSDTAYTILSVCLSVCPWVWKTRRQPRNRSA